MAHLTGTVPTSLMSTSMIRIPMGHLKSIWQLQAMARLGSTLICMRVVKYVWVCWAHGEAVHLKIGTLRCLLCCKCFYQSKPLLWVNKSTSTSPALKGSKELRREKRKTKHILTLLDIATLNSQWLTIWKIHPKDSNTSSDVISTWNNIK